MKILRTTSTPLPCRVFGHRWTFDAVGADVVRRCERGCDEESHHPYGSVAEAARVAFHLREHLHEAPVGVMPCAGGVIVPHGTQVGRELDLH